MRFYILILPILIASLVLTEFVLSADRSPGTNTMRWGITTNESKEDNTDEQQTEKKAVDDENAKPQPKSKPEHPPVPDVESPAKEADKAVTAADSKEPQKTETTKPDVDVYPDRPWIIKEEHMKQRSPSGEKPRAVNWKNEKQQIQCESTLKQIRENFLRSRYYSLKGDFCQTANYAKSFLDIVEDCKQGCPEKFLEYNGYTVRIIRNLSWLEELGSAQCLGRKKTTQTGKR